jgi:hypothetical protein
LLTYPASIPLSTHTLSHLAQLVRAHRKAIGCRWRRLDPGRQALLVLAHLRNGDTYTRLAAGFGIGIATVYRYIREAVDLLATQAPNLRRILQTAARFWYLILDGTLIRIDRIAEDRPYYSGKHKRHGVNVQVLTDPRRRLLWASAASPGSTHDLTAAALTASSTPWTTPTCGSTPIWPTKAPARTSPSRSDAGPVGCRATSGQSTATVPGTGHPANAPSPRSKSGRS